ncbi:cysteine hydrolase [Lysinibacillus composti]|uniref:Cysteine hydrolase n=2 Tax=Lysinibacillus composti TaxID=720633 RepID=A0A3N9UEQ2_9BACI|nr:cysteine hydrolase [Lysinibacillus composti]
MMRSLYNLIPEETALLVIDMQNGYCHLNGSIGSTGADVSQMNATIPHVKKLVEECRAAGILDIWTKQHHYADDITKEKHRILPHNRRGKTVPKNLAIKNSWDSQFVDELKELAATSEEIIIKHRFSAFLDTRLETLLRMKGINTLIVCGVVTTHCVESTVRDGYQKDYDMIVVNEGVGAFSNEANRASLKLMNQYFGIVISQEEALKLITEKQTLLNYA